MPIVVVKLLEGRTVEQKRELIHEITDVVARVAKAPQKEVEVIIDDYPRENWAKGGTLFYDK